MKLSTLHALITARALYDQALRLIESDDKFLCSAGLVVLQDALEIVFIALLCEKGVDERKALENKSFDELMGELRAAGLAVPKTGTLKALNKQRVITKHYGQICEPQTVRVYAEAGDVALTSLMNQAFGKTLQEIYLTELLSPNEARDFLQEAAAHIDQGEFFRALISVRKALFIEIESGYSVSRWAEGARQPQGIGGRLSFLMRPSKAPYYTQNVEWVKNHVREPTEYVQINQDLFRSEAMEWGVSTADLENLRRLTPAVFRFAQGGEWFVKFDVSLTEGSATLANARYCLDRAVAVLFRKQQHEKSKRWIKAESSLSLDGNYTGAAVYRMATQDSEVIDHIQVGGSYEVRGVAAGFAAGEKYFEIIGRVSDRSQPLGIRWVSGYLLVRQSD